MPTLKSFYAAEGEDLWRCRHSLSAPSGSLEEPPVECHWMRRVQETPPAIMVTSAEVFREMEAATGGGGGALVKRGKQGPVRTALTGVSGQTWIRQRHALTEKVLPFGLGHGRPEVFAVTAGRRLSAQLAGLCEASAQTSPRRDLKELFEVTFAEWILELVLGLAAEESQDIVTEFLGYWRRIRTKIGGPNQLKPDPEANQRLYKQMEGLAQGAREKCAAADLGGDFATQGCSLLEALARCSLATESLTPEEIVPNIYSFLVAGFETTYSIALWTVVALGDPAHDSLRQRVEQECVRANACEETLARQRAALQQLKKAATAGEPLPEAARRAGGEEEDMLLVRCLAETCRVFPPVWGLPRALTKEYGPTLSSPRIPEGSWVSADVLCINGDTREGHVAWEPEKPWPCRAGPASLATWGVGARSCPAGTGALLAAWTVLRLVLADFSFLETSLAQTVREAYLGVTLCSDGPVPACVRRRTEEDTSAASPAA